MQRSETKVFDDDNDKYYVFAVKVAEKGLNQATRKSKRNTQAPK